MQTALIIIHVVISVILIGVVLMQHGKQQGLSGAIAGGAETFFGKNKGRTIDAMLKKVTSVVAVLFVISSVTFAVYSIQKNKPVETPEAQTETNGEAAEGEGIQTQLDEDGNLVDENGNILMSAEDVKKAEEEANKAQAEEAAEGETAEEPAETETAE